MQEWYPDGATCWRRLRRWEERGVWLRDWRKLLGQLDERKLLDWEEAVLDATFVTAKKGRRHHSTLLRVGFPGIRASPRKGQHFPVGSRESSRRQGVFHRDTIQTVGGPDGF